MPAAPFHGLQKPTSLQQKGACEMEIRGPSCSSPDKDKKHNSVLNTSEKFCSAFGRQAEFFSWLVNNLCLSNV